jgi:hypothetical protein
MCDCGDAHDLDRPSADPALDPVLSGHYHPSRRSVLHAGGAAALAAATSAIWLPSSAWGGASPRSLTGTKPVRNAMHVHASWSEGNASWESQFAQAAAIGTDVLWMTDHDFRALAFQYLTSLVDIGMVNSQTGSLAQSVAGNTGGVVRVLAESASSSAASVSCAIEVKPAAWFQLRTSIAGQRLTASFPAARIDSGGSYDVVVLLSNHPAHGTRPAGQFELHYRFGNLASGRFVDASGIVGVVTHPTPAPGSQFTFDLTADVASLWPDMLAIDNSFVLLTFVATSPSKGTVVDVSLSLTIARSQNTSDALIANQRTIVATYGPRYPAMAAYPSVEISRLDPHFIPFGVPQFWPDQTTISDDNHDAAYDAITSSVHAQGGLVSWNHPFGASGGPLLPAAQQVTNRRAVFASMMSDKRLGADLIEVGYTVRGMVNTQTHLDLWDTFSRQAVFLTGNGVNDDHAGLHWSTLSNGFTTGIWAKSPSQADLVSALASGRAYTHHAGKWPNAQLDLSVGGTVPMGKVSVKSVNSRPLSIFATNLPKNSLVQVVRGPVDFAGSDPGTKVVATIKAATFAKSGLASLAISTTSSCFVRVQVRPSAGVIVGISNPIWLLRKPPAAGIPPARLA